MQSEAKQFKFSRPVKSALNRAAHRLALAQCHRVVAESRDGLIERLVEHIITSYHFTDDELIKVVEQASEAETQAPGSGDE